MVRPGVIEFLQDNNCKQISLYLTIPPPPPPPGLLILCLLIDLIMFCHLTAVNEVYLFHGSKGKKEDICHEGLDQRLSRIGHFGRGIYFSNDVRKCFFYTKERKEHSEPKESTVYKCRVLLGIVKVCCFKLKEIIKFKTKFYTQQSVPHKGKIQHVHFRFYTNYFLLPWRVPEEISRQSMFFNY